MNKKVTPDLRLKQLFLASSVGKFRQALRSGLEFTTKYHILHDFRTSTPFEETSSDHFKDLCKLKLLTNFDVNLTSFLG